jgi:signal transduction histidine kinase
MRIITLDRIDTRADQTTTRPEEDLLGDFAPLVVVIRWATIAIGLAYAVAGGAELGDLVGAAVLALHALFRTVRPLRYYRDNLLSLLMVLAEVGLTLGVVVATGYWRSPYTLALANAIVAAGFARGFAFAIRTAVTAVLAVAIPFHLRDTDAAFDLTLQWGGELLLVALVAGYARRLFREAEERTSEALDRMRDLSEANQLLHQLHGVAQRLPASLDLDEVMASTVEHVRTLFPIDIVAVILWDDGAVSWRVGAAEGARLSRTYRHEDLPAPIRRAVATGEATVYNAVDGPPSGGLGQRSALGAYAPLRSRDQVIGVLAVECHPGGSLGAREVELLTGVADQAALAIDNARWFGRLRTVGADEERTRIARDLHDRVGQSLAFLAFELDRIERQAEGTPLAAELDRLRQDVRRVVGEVRDTLYDLRTDVSEEDDLTSTLAAYLKRVEQRSDLDVDFHHHTTKRPPLLVERELWRIAQEAVTNAERHAAAKRLAVRWELTNGEAMLEVSDDGKGLPDEPRDGGYGLLGMRERADAIGARLEVSSSEGEGTTVRCTVKVGE